MLILKILKSQTDEKNMYLYEKIKPELKLEQSSTKLILNIVKRRLEGTFKRRITHF